MKMSRSILLFVMFGTWTMISWAGIPEPDTILYGELYVNGKLIMAKDDVTIFAKLNGVEITKYKMGSNSQAGNEYALRLPMQSTDDGIVNPLAAKFGDNIQIYVKQGFGSQVKVLNPDFHITGRGIVKFHRLFVGMSCGTVEGDFNQDCRVNLADLSLFASQWMRTSCVSPGWCDGYDINKDGSVSMFDLIIMANNWLKCVSVECY